MRETHFDLKSILKIDFIEEREDESYIWRDSKEIKLFLGFGKPKFTKEGFFYVRTFDSYWVSEDIMKSIGLKIIGKKAYKKPYVIVHLSNSISITKNFEDNQEAKLWIEELTKKSGKNFEILKF